ncbi:MAG TPA: hypothetical protein VF954_06930 [Acidimicrobiales bacterium]
MSPCPACGRPLSPASAPGGRRYLCAACHLVVVGLPVLRAAIGRPAEAAVWLASETVAAGDHPCPFCAQGMRPVQAPPGPAGRAQAQVCRSCEVVAVAADQWPLLPQQPADPAVAAPTAATDLRCPTCGAPRQATPDNCCRYCGGKLAMEPTVVFVPTAASGDRFGDAPGKIEAAASLLSALTRVVGWAAGS